MQEYSDIFASQPSDLVSLRCFTDYIDNPDLFKPLLEQQGIENVDFVEVTGPLSGGSEDNNYKGYIHWTDGTQSKVQIKGKRTGTLPPGSYRESLFYSRIVEDFNPKYTKTVGRYVDVADTSNGNSMMINEFMVNYADYGQFTTSYLNGNLEEDYGIPQDSFDPVENTIKIMEMLAAFSASHWMDASLQNEWYLRGIDWAQGYNQDSYMGNQQWMSNYWSQQKQQPDLIIDDNTRAIIDQVYALWNWDVQQELFASDDYFWGLTHGDFTPPQIMIDLDDLDELVLLDWEFGGGYGNPGTDLGNWFFEVDYDWLMEHEEVFLHRYWTTLILSGVDAKQYPFERFKIDYLAYGTSQGIAKRMFGAALSAYTIQDTVDLIANWVDMHNLTPDMIGCQVYGLF